jgi:hypothetical protein
MRTVMILGLILSAVNYVFSQDSTATEPEYGWQKTIVGGVNLTQTNFDNWAQGGENSNAWQLNLTYKFVNDQQKLNWSNSGKFNYGETKTGKSESRKSIDEIKLESVLTYKMGILVNPFVAVTGETQFVPGYSYSETGKTKISNFLDPAYLRESIGLGIKPDEIISTRVGFAAKQTLAGDFAKVFSDDPQTAKIEKVRNELGADSVTDFNWKFSESSVLTSKLELFSNLKAFDEIDVNWDNILSTKISEYISFNFDIKIFYDKNISAKRQVKQALALGLSYTFL